MASNRALPRRVSVLSYIAFWQFMAFGILLCLVWASEILDLRAAFFGAPHSSPDYLKACILTSAVLLSAIITAGNTYLQQRHILKGLLEVCASCGRVRIQPDTWQEMENFFEQHTLASFRRETCPVCLNQIGKELADSNMQKWKQRDTPQTSLTPSHAG
jgi:hypothetical protein